MVRQEVLHTGPDVTHTRRVPARRLLAGAGVLSLLLAGSALAWEWRHPDLFAEPPPSKSASSDRWPVDEPLFVGMTYEHRDAGGTITIDRAEANVVTNTAAARIEFFLCVVADGSAGLGSIGGWTGVREVCGELTPVEDSMMRLNAKPRELVVMGVTATQPGLIEVAGAELSYAYGWQRGSQDIGEYVSLKTVD